MEGPLPGLSRCGCLHPLLSLGSEGGGGDGVGRRLLVLVTLEARAIGRVAAAGDEAEPRGDLPQHSRPSRSVVASGASKGQARPVGGQDRIVEGVAVRGADYFVGVATGAGRSVSLPAQALPAAIDRHHGGLNRLLGAHARPGRIRRA